MAKLRVFQTIENDIWQLRFELDPTSLSESDKDLMQKFGEPEINAGGSYLGEGDAFTLPDKYIKVRSGLPYVQSFDAKSSPFDTNTEVKVTGYRDAFITNYTTAFTTLRANSDDFTGEKLYTI